MTGAETCAKAIMDNDSPIYCSATSSTIAVFPARQVQTRMPQCDESVDALSTSLPLSKVFRVTWSFR